MAACCLALLLVSGFSTTAVPRVVVETKHWGFAGRLAQPSESVEDPEGAGSGLPGKQVATAKCRIHTPHHAAYAPWLSRLRLSLVVTVLEPPAESSAQAILAHEAIPQLAVELMREPLTQKVMKIDVGTEPRTLHLRTDPATAAQRFCAEATARVRQAKPDHHMPLDCVGRTEQYIRSEFPADELAAIELAPSAMLRHACATTPAGDDTCRRPFRVRASVRVGGFNEQIVLDRLLDELAFDFEGNFQYPGLRLFGAFFNRHGVRIAVELLDSDGNRAVDCSTDAFAVPTPALDALEYERLPSGELRSSANPLYAWWWHKHRSGLGRIVQKPLEYLDTYHKFFGGIRAAKHRLAEPVRVLEIGVQSGGSIEMWRAYFGDDVQIFGIDIEPECATLQDENVTIFIGDQGDRSFMEGVARSVAQRVGDGAALDVVVDDGSHNPAHQVGAFEVLYPLLGSDGVYVCEDTDVNYQPTGQPMSYHELTRQPGGAADADGERGTRRQGRFIELVKGLTDKLQARTMGSVGLLDAFGRSTESIHFYTSMVVIQKHAMRNDFLELVAGDSSKRIAERYSTEVNRN